MVEYTNTKEVRILNKMTMEQLARAEKKLVDVRRIMIDQADEHQRQVWKMKDARDHARNLRDIVRTIMGRKKGEHCLALCKDSQGNWTCKAKKDRYWFRQKHDVYETACARCRYKVKTKRDKMVFGQIFAKSP